MVLPIIVFGRNIGIGVFVVLVNGLVLIMKCRIFNQRIGGRDVMAKKVTLYHVDFGIAVNVPKLAELIKADLQVIIDKYGGAIASYTQSIKPTRYGTIRYKKLIREDRALVKKLNNLVR